MATATDTLMTPKQVADRWGVAEDHVWQAVDDGDSPLPFIYLGRGSPAKGRAGQRGLYRFRSEAVEAWERAKERAFTRPEDDADPEAIAALAAFEHDGKARGGRRGRSGSRAGRA